MESIDKQPKSRGNGKRRTHPNSLENLKLGTLWKRGQSGNPKGRPKRQSIGEAVYEKLLESYPNDPTKTNMQALAEVIVREALDGNFAFAKEVIERIDGRKPIGIKLSQEIPFDDKEDSAPVTPEKAMEEIRSIEHDLMLLKRSHERQFFPSKGIE